MDLNDTQDSIVYIIGEGDEFQMHLLPMEKAPMIEIAKDQWLTSVYLHMEEEIDTYSTDCNDQPDYTQTGDNSGFFGRSFNIFN